MLAGMMVGAEAAMFALVFNKIFLLNLKETWKEEIYSPLLKTAFLYKMVCH